MLRAPIVVGGRCDRRGVAAEIVDAARDQAQVAVVYRPPPVRGRHLELDPTQQRQPTTLALESAVWINRGVGDGQQHPYSTIEQAAADARAGHAVDL